MSTVQFHGKLLWTFYISIFCKPLYLVPSISHVALHLIELEGDALPGFG
jgi:hypothetical protein